jgi:hypothetical protein
LRSQLALYKIRSGLPITKPPDKLFNSTLVRLELDQPLNSTLVLLKACTILDNRLVLVKLHKFLNSHLVLLNLDNLLDCTLLLPRRCHQPLRSRLQIRRLADIALGTPRLQSQLLWDTSNQAGKANLLGPASHLRIKITLISANAQVANPSGEPVASSWAVQQPQTGNSLADRYHFHIR